MEFKRKLDDQGDGRSHGDVFPELPESIKLRLDSLTKRSEFELARKDPELVQTLDAHDLSHQKISEQMVGYANKGRTPKQLAAIMDFLVAHHNSVMSGEPPVPLTSKFRRVPFSYICKVQK